MWLVNLQRPSKNGTGIFLHLLIHTPMCQTLVAGLPRACASSTLSSPSGLNEIRHICRAWRVECSNNEGIAFPWIRDSATFSPTEKHLLPGSCECCIIYTPQSHPHAIFLACRHFVPLRAEEALSLVSSLQTDVAFLVLLGGPFSISCLEPLHFLAGEPKSPAVQAPSKRPPQSDHGRMNHLQHDWILIDWAAIQVGRNGGNFSVSHFFQSSDLHIR